MRFRAVAIGISLALASTTPTYAAGPHGGGFHGGGGGFHGGRGFHGGGGAFHGGGGGFHGAGASQASRGIQVGRSAGFAGQSHVRAFGGAPSGTAHVGSYGRGGGFGRGFGYGAGGLAVGYGLGYGSYGYDNPGYADYSYADPGVTYAQPDAVYASGAQYSDDPGYDTQSVQTGRSAARIGQSCATPVKVCMLYNQSYVGGPCSCKIPGGRSSGHVSP